MASGAAMRVGFYFGILLTGVCSLRDVSVKIPSGVIRGEDAVLECSYDLEGDQLYSVKWYLGTTEFYRYTPRENPPQKQFPSSNRLVVKEIESNEHRVVLERVPMSVSGRYTCEVSADAPSFYTMMHSAHLQVVDLPRQDPYISRLKTRYHYGDMLKANCTSEHSNPAANLTWYINGMPADLIHVRNYKSRSEDGQFYTAHSALKLKVSESLFLKHRLKIRCVASMFDIYIKSTEKSVESERRRHSHQRFHTTTTAESPLQGELAQSAETHSETILVFQAPAASGIAELLRLNSAMAFGGVVVVVLFRR